MWGAEFLQKKVLFAEPDIQNYQYIQTSIIYAKLAKLQSKLYILIPW